MTAQNAMNRAAFEAWISAPPYEREVLRYPDEPWLSAWPGQYRSIMVDLAWKAWQEALKAGIKAGMARASHTARNATKTPAFEAILAEMEKLR